MDSSHKNLKSILDLHAVRGKVVTSMQKEGRNDLIQSIIFKNQMKEPFYVMDLGVVVSLMDQWTWNLPGVHPFYAVKCNPEPSFLATMAALGSGFDCASRAEIELVLALGVSPDRIIFANPCKPESHIKYAAAVGINLTTFDSSYEIEKIKKYHPKCDLLIRVKPPGTGGGARCELGQKYGALPDEVEPLLLASKEAGLNVLGVSFHIGSGDADPNAYLSAIALAKFVFDTTTSLGMPPMKLLDIGGGFTAGSQFDTSTIAIKSGLEEYFKNHIGLNVISEPGRFFAESAFTLVANVIGKRVRGEQREYWINDGVYGSMNCILYDHATVTALPFASMSKPLNPTCQGESIFPSTVFGPTCDGLDTVTAGAQLPELQVNDYLLFRNMGAYTAAAGSSFNGFDTSSIPTHLAYLYPN